MDTGQRCRRRPRPTRDRRPLHAADVTAGRIDLAASIDLAACPLVSSHHVFHVKRRPRNCVRRGGQLGSWVRHRPRSTDRHSVGCWPSRTVHRSAARRHPDSTVTPNPPDVGQPCSVSAARPGGSSRGLGDSSHEVRARTSQVAKSRLAESRSPECRSPGSRSPELRTSRLTACEPGTQRRGYSQQKPWVPRAPPTTCGAQSSLPTAAPRARSPRPRHRLEANASAGGHSRLPARRPPCCQRRAP